MAGALQVVPDLEDLTGRQKVAIVLMALGEEEAGKVTSMMDPDEVEAISLEIAKLDRVDQTLVAQVIEEWQHTERAAVSIAEGGVTFAKRILENAFGPTKAAAVLKRIEGQLHDHISLRNLKSADAQQITDAGVEGGRQRFSRSPGGRGQSFTSRPARPSGSRNSRMRRSSSPVGSRVSATLGSIASSKPVAATTSSTLTPG